MRYLGIDYGRKRIGVALSDPDGRMAFPRGAISADDFDRVLERLTEIIHESQAGAVVVGLPQVPPGGDSSFVPEVRALAKELGGRCGVPVYFADERFTSKVAEQSSPDAVDAAAAALILQGFLDRQNTLSSD